MIKIYDGRSEFYQWDLDRQLIISDPIVDEVHFSNKMSDKALVVEVKTTEVFAHGTSATIRTADVPNILLQAIWPIRAYAYCGDCYTKECATFKVNERTRPDDYVYTETEVKRWDDLLEEIRDAEKRLDDNIGYYVPSVDDEGNLSWQSTNSKHPAVETVNIRGEKGDPGEVTLAYAHSTFANVVRGKAEGTVAVAIKDVSPIEHNINCHVEAAGCPIKLYGKNLISGVGATAYVKGKVESIEGGIRWKAGSTYYLHIPCNIPKGVTLSYSFNYNSVGGTDASGSIRLEYSDGSKVNFYQGTTLTQDMVAFVIYKSSPATALTADVDITNIQIEIGETPTEYAPYIEPVTHITDDNGAIKDIKSISTGMTFVAEDNDMATITVQYNRDINAVIEQLTNAIISLGGNV